MLSSDAENGAPELKFLHAIDSFFQNVVNYKTYCLLEKSQTFNGNMAVRMNKHAKRMKPLMGTYKFDDIDPITPLRFSTLIKGAWGLHRIFEGMTLWIMPTPMKDEPASSLTVYMTSYGDNRKSSRLPKVDEGQIPVLVKVVSFLLKSYATDLNIERKRQT